jgi:type II restriction/modification system DNA methylase subunit YeeA
MNRTKLKNYAPQARRDFIQAMTDRAALYGLTANKIEPVVEKGDVAVIAGREHPRAVAKKRKQLEDRIKRHGLDQTMEAMAYTWFNRLVAIRFMELHGYLDHGYRVLSHPEGKATPEILEHAEQVDLPGLKKEVAIDLKLAGNKEAELYRLLLTAQCNALHAAMPFLFEKIDDETELLLPDNLLHSDSLIRKLVNEIDEEDWQAVEIIGWLYQFYISEKKDEVIGKVVASEDIPAATQLFTPNWIVKYLVQNTLGRQWLATYPQSALRQQMQYYIEPAEQTPEVQEQLKAITPTSLNPEELTLLDPACGSGHILVDAYDLFKAIYQERGYRAKDIPALILQKNLFGLEIDDRAAQLAAVALMMKARADDRRIFDSEAKPNILAFQDSQGMNAGDITHALNSPILKEEMPPSQYLMEEIEEDDNPLFNRKTLSEKGHVALGDLATLLELFENAKTFGSLIQVPPTLAVKLPEIEQRLNDVLTHGDLTHASAYGIKPLLQQARLLASQYDTVVANPPYMGGKYFAGKLKDFVADSYKDAKADLYACFIQRNLAFAESNGFIGMITIPNWMFLSSFEVLRRSLLDNQTIDSFIHNGRGVFGSDFGTCSFILRNQSLPAYRGVFRRLFDKQGSVASIEELNRRFFNAKSFSPANRDFARIRRAPLAYWVSDNVRSVFAENPCIGDISNPSVGLQPGDTAAFVRFWHEVDYSRTQLPHLRNATVANESVRWYLFNKGGEYRKWFGNTDYLVDWENNGSRLRQCPGSRPQGRENYFKEGATWSAISSGILACRLQPFGTIYSNAGMAAFGTAEEIRLILGLLNSPVGLYCLSVINPSINYGAETIGAVPYRPVPSAVVTVSSLVEKSQVDWNDSETSWGFESLPAVRHRTTTYQQAQETADVKCSVRFEQVKELEEQNNRLFIGAYGLQDELSPEVPDDQITLSRPDRAEDIGRLLSYAIGCMMGRYSLDKPGLIYAQSGNQGFDPSHYKTFRADDDGIIPLLETDWGIRDDASNRTVEFIGVAWPKEHLEENLKFIADSLGPNNGEQSRDTIRRYLATGFYRHHLSMYKRRPIYWLFTSGKQRAFQCLVYLHRYHEGTLARMRTEYVIPLQGQIAARTEQLEGDKTKATSTSHRRKLQKEQDDLKKRQAELAAFEEKLKHAADQKISLDLDNGVKVNYGKFGDLLAEAKAITGGKDDE